jgi:hypothetical protein
MPVSIIGTRGSGKSTFIDLLYQTMVYYTDDPKTRKTLNYYWRPEFKNLIMAELKAMMEGGGYPPSTDTGDKLIYSFLVGFKPGHLEKLGERAKYLIKGGEFNSQLCLIMDLFDIAGEDLEEFATDPKGLPQLARMFDNNILVMTIDCSRFTMEVEGPQSDKQREYDYLVAEIISGYTKYRSQKAQKDHNFNKNFYPIFVLTQVDQMDGRIMANHGVDEIVDPKTNSEGERIIDVNDLIEKTKLYKPDDSMKKLWKMCNKSANEIMASHMPHTYGILNGANLMMVPLEDDAIQYFLSWTANKKVGESVQIQKARMHYSNDHTYETPIYSRHMYVAFLSYLRNIVEVQPDRQDMIARMLNDSKWNDPQ